MSLKNEWEKVAAWVFPADKVIVLSELITYSDAINTADCVAEVRPGERSSLRFGLAAEDHLNFAARGRRFDERRRFPE